MPREAMGSEGYHLDPERIEPELPRLGIEVVPVAVQRAHPEDEPGSVLHPLIEPALRPSARPGRSPDRNADRLLGDPLLDRFQVQAASREPQLLAEENRHCRATSRYRPSRAVTSSRSWAMKVRAQSVARA